MGMPPRQRMQETAESRVQSRGGWRDGCGVVVVAMGRLMCPLVYAKGQIVREGCGADRALTADGGRNGTAAVAIIAFTVVATTARANTTTNTTTVTATIPPVAAPLALRLGVGPPLRESGSESEFEPRVTKDEGESESGGP